MSKPDNKALSARDRKMYNMRQDGHSLEVIARLHNVSRATAGRGVTRHKQLLQAAVIKRVKDKQDD